MIRFLRSYWPFLSGLLAGVFFITLQVTGLSLTHFPGDLIDGRFNNYLLEHAYHYFSGQTDSFWNAPFMYPEPNVISYSDNLLGTAPFYAFFRVLGCDRDTAYQCWFILLSILNYAACYFFLNFLFGNRYAAVLGAMVFAFSIALQAQMGHAQTFPRFPVPLAFWMGCLFVRDLKPVYFFWTVFFVVYEIYCGMYLGLMLCIPVALFILTAFYVRRSVLAGKLKSPGWWGAMAAALALNAAILWPLIKPYLARATEIGLYPYEYVSKSLLTPWSYLFSRVGNLYWGFLQDLRTDYEAYWDHQVFAGGLATLCLLAFLVFVFLKLISRHLFKNVTVDEPVKVLFFTAVLTFLLFIRVRDVSLYKLIYAIPGFGSMRALQRIMQIELVFYAVATAFMLRFLFQKESKLAGGIFLVCVTVFILDNYLRPDNIHRREVSQSKARVEPLIGKMKDIPRTHIVSYEPDSIDSSINDFQLDAMLASQSLNLKTLNGYSATSPVGYSGYWISPNPESRMAWLNTKGMPGEKVVVVH